MALINCPECKNEISDKVKSCPNCGSPIIKEKPKTICPECKKELSDKAKACPSCGCPIKKKPNKKKILIGVGIFLVLWVFVSAISSEPTEPKTSEPALPTTSDTTPTVSATTPITSEPVSKIIPDTSPKNGWTLYRGDKYVSIDSTRQELIDAFGKDNITDKFFGYESSIGKFMNDGIYSIFMDFPSDWHMLNGLDESTTEAVVMQMYSLKSDEREKNIDYSYKIYLKKDGQELVRCEESEAEFDMEINIEKEYLQSIRLKKRGIKTNKLGLEPKLASQTYASILSDIYVDENLSLFNGEIAISIDTEKEDLVKFLESSSMDSYKESSEKVDYFVFDDIIMSFEDGKPTGLLTNKSDKWVTSRGIGVGSTQEEALEAYQLTESDMIVVPDVPNKKGFIIYYKNVAGKTVECKNIDHEYKVIFNTENGYVTNVLISR